MRRPGLTPSFGVAVRGCGSSTEGAGATTSGRCVPPLPRRRRAADSEGNPMDDAEAGTPSSPAKDPGSAVDAEHQPELDGDGADRCRRPPAASAAVAREAVNDAARARTELRATLQGRRRSAPGMAPAPPADQPELPESPARVASPGGRRAHARAQAADRRHPSGPGRSRCSGTRQAGHAKAVAPQAVVARTWPWVRRSVAGGASCRRPIAAARAQRPPDRALHNVCPGP